MRHYRLLALVVAIAAALSIPAAGSSTPADQVKGSACGDITLWDPDHSGPPVYTDRFGSATVYASLTTAKPSCSGTTYTIYVYDASGSTLLTSQQYAGDDATSEFSSFTYAPPDAPRQVCIAATSSREDHIIDAAPNGGGCYVLVLDVSPGGSGLN